MRTTDPTVPPSAPNRSKLYPDLIKDVEIRVIELMDGVLSTYDRAISIYTGEQFKRAGEGCGVCVCSHKCQGGGSPFGMYIPVCDA